MVVLVITILLDSTEIQNVWWACHFCKVEYSSYFKLDILTGNLNKTITASKRPTNNSIHDVIEREKTLSVELHSFHASLVRGFRTQCFGFVTSVEVSSLLRRFKVLTDRIDFDRDCLHHNALAFEIAGEKLNQTVFYRGSVDERWNSVCSTTLAKVYPVSSSSLLWEIYTNTQEYILLARNPSTAKI